MKINEIIKAVEPYVNKSVDEIIHDLHIDVVRDNDFLYGDMARLIWMDDIVVIFLREDLNEQYEMILMLHEIAHYILHLKDFTISENTARLEKEAEFFVCLYLTHLDHSSFIYYPYLVNCGIAPAIAANFDEVMLQYHITHHEPSHYHLEP